MISHYRRTALQKNPCKWITIKLSSSFWGPWPVGEGDEKSKVEFTCLATSPELTGTWETRILVVSLLVWSQLKEMYCEVKNLKKSLVKLIYSLMAIKINLG